MSFEQGAAKGSSNLVDLQAEHKMLKERIDEINHGIKPVSDEELARMKLRKLSLKRAIAAENTSLSIASARVLEGPRAYA